MYIFDFSKFNKNDGFIVQSLYIVFYLLERCSVFYWVRYIFSNGFKYKNKKPLVMTYIFPEIWMVSNVIFAIISGTLIKTYNLPKFLIIILFVYAFLRVVEMFVYQINVLFFHRLNQYMLVNNDNKKTKNKKKQKDEYVLKSATRTIIMLIFNMVEYILQFTVMFAALACIFENDVFDIGIIDSFMLFQTMGDLGAFEGKTMLFFVYFETIIGLFMNILCIARFINEMPQINKIDN